MIDKIQIYKLIKLDTNNLNKKFHNVNNSKFNIYVYNFNNISIIYNVDTFRLKIRGRLAKLLENNTRITNIDTLIKNNSLDSIIDILNNKVAELINNQREIDIRYFKISYIEICFNFKVTNVDNYIKLYNNIYQYNKEILNKLNRYKNLVIEENKNNYTSCYIKTKSEYENKTRNNYAINFYNKLDQVQTLQIKSALDKKYKYIKVTPEDIETSKNILRLEIQCSYNYLRSFKKKFNIDKDDIILKTFIYNPELCKSILEDKYKMFIDNINNKFYSYVQAKDIIERSTMDFKRGKKDVLRYLQAIAQNSVHNQFKSKQTQKTYNIILQQHNISKYLIPKSFNVDKLNSLNELFKNNYYVQDIKYN